MANRRTNRPECQPPKCDKISVETSAPSSYLPNFIPLLRHGHVYIIRLRYGHRIVANGSAASASWPWLVPILLDLVRGRQDNVLLGLDLLAVAIYPLLLLRLGRLLRFRTVEVQVAELLPYLGGQLGAVYYVALGIHVRATLAMVMLVLWFVDGGRRNEHFWPCALKLLVDIENARFRAEICRQIKQTAIAHEAERQEHQQDQEFFTRPK